MKKAETNELATRLGDKVVQLQWEERGIKSGHPEVEIALMISDLELKLEALTQKFNDYRIETDNYVNHLFDKIKVLQEKEINA